MLEPQEKKRANPAFFVAHNWSVMWLPSMDLAEGAREAIAMTAMVRDPFLPLVIAVCLCSKHLSLLVPSSSEHREGFDPLFTLLCRPHPFPLAWAFSSALISSTLSQRTSFFLMLSLPIHSLFLSRSLSLSSLSSLLNLPSFSPDLSPCFSIPRSSHPLPSFAIRETLPVSSCRPLPFLLLPASYI